MVTPANTKTAEAIEKQKEDFEYEKVSRREAVTTLRSKGGNAEFAAKFDRLITKTDTLITSKIYTAFANAGIDGFGIEGEIEAEGQFLGGATGAVGVSVLWLTNGPEVGGPYIYIYVAAGLSGGIEASAHTGGEVYAFIAEYDGKAKDITPSSWEGAFYTVEAEGGAGAEGYVEVGVGAFASPTYGMFDIASGDNSDGWFGISSGASFGTGAGGGISLSVVFSDYVELDRIRNTLAALYEEGEREAERTVDEIEQEIESGVWEVDTDIWKLYGAYGL